MDSVAIGIGTNLGNKTQNLIEAGTFLQSISERHIVKASIYETEPIGIADQPFYNTAALIYTNDTPEVLFNKLKDFEKKLGRIMDAPRWSNRLIDLDIIGMGKLILHSTTLDIPHRRYSERLFVLQPLQEICPKWVDPETGEHISQLLLKAPKMSISKTALKW